MASDYEKITEYNEEQLGKDTASRKSQVVMYSDFSHFVYEILQNADDYDATTVQFKLTSSELVIEHNGIPFSEENVRAISYFGKSTSRDDLVKTGRFGLGFKSVFAFTSTPALHSGEENFEISGLYRLSSLSSPDDLVSNKTRICLPFNHEEKRPDYVEALVTKEDAFRRISQRLKNIDITSLLFTRNIMEIIWMVGNESGHYLREDKLNQEISSGLQTRRSEITDGSTLHTYLVYSRPVKWNGESYKPVDIAFQVDTDGSAEGIHSIRKPLSVLFPTTQDTHMGFLMNGPYRTPAHRETVSQDDPFNGHLVNETASLLCQLLADIKDKGLLTVNLLEILPIRANDFPIGSMFRPIYDKVRDTLHNQELLPKTGGGHVAGEKAYLARGQELVSLLFFKDRQWLTTEITETRQDLYRYLVGWRPRWPESGEEIKPLIAKEYQAKDFIEFLGTSQGSEFLVKQNDDWFGRFYSFLSNQISFRTKLRRLRIIRLQDNTHVKPFDDDGKPNAYLPPEEDTDFPVIKSVHVENEEILMFFKDLGIPELDIVAEVLEKVLPKYNQESHHHPDDEHQRDMAKIIRAYATDSQEKKRLLSNRLKETAFIFADNPVSQQMAYRMPGNGDLYLKNNDLLLFFNGNEDVWYVDRDYDPSFHSLFKNLGVRDSVSVRRKPTDRNRYVTIADNHGWHVRGLNGFDPGISVDGLEYALTHPTIEKSLFIWNTIACNNSNCICGVVEKCPRQDFSGCDREELTSTFGRMLMDTSWLPNSEGDFHKPNELGLDDLREEFNCDEKLSDVLNMKQNIVEKLAREVGISQNSLDIARKLESSPSLRVEVESLIHKLSIDSNPIFPLKRLKNRTRREGILIDAIRTAPKKNYKPGTVSERTTRSSIDPAAYLRGHYTSESHQMVCQICKKEMPFKKRNGEYYFEAVEAFNSDVLPKELEAQFLACCPLCAAMYQEFVKRDDGAIEDFKREFVNSAGVEIPIELGKIRSTILFTEAHFFDLTIILREYQVGR